MVADYADRFSIVKVTREMGYLKTVVANLYFRDQPQYLYAGLPSPAPEATRRMPTLYAGLPSPACTAGTDWEVRRT